MVTIAYITFASCCDQQVIRVRTDTSRTGDDVVVHAANDKSVRLAKSKVTPNNEKCNSSLVYPL